jgi:hypothetical protein
LKASPGLKSEESKTPGKEKEPKSAGLKEPKSAGLKK